MIYSKFLTKYKIFSNFIINKYQNHENKSIIHFITRNTDYFT